MTAENTAIALGMITGTALHWQTPTDLLVLNNTHPITTGLALGVQNLGYTYMSHPQAVDLANTTTLASGPGGPALVVHNDRRVVITPYYGHSANHDLENQTGLDTTQQSLIWAAEGTVSVEASSWARVKATHHK